MEKAIRSFIVHIECMENNVPKGWFMNPYLQKYVTFTDLGDMVLKIDDSLHLLMKLEEQDEMTCYHPFQDFVVQSRPEFFYLIQILYTSYHSWQGVISGTNCPNTTFKSALDCLHKMDQAMRNVLYMSI